MDREEEFSVYFHPDAHKELESIEKEYRTKIDQKIELLKHPYECNALKLKGK